MTQTIVQVHISTHVTLDICHTDPLSETFTKYEVQPSTTFLSMKSTGMSAAVDKRCTQWLTNQRGLSYRYPGNDSVPSVQTVQSVQAKVS